MPLNFPVDPLRLPSPAPCLSLISCFLEREDLDEGLKTFLLRCACGPPSIFHDSQTRLCSMDGLCTAILKSKNLPFLPHWEQKEFQKRVRWFQGYQARWDRLAALESWLYCELYFGFIWIKAVGPTWMTSHTEMQNDKLKHGNMAVSLKRPAFMSEDVMEIHRRCKLQ